MTNALIAQMGARIRTWRENPVAFVHENFGVEPDAWQREALVAFASPAPEHRRISLQACVGPGKSAVLAWCGLNFLSCHGDEFEHPKGAAVSITRDNLRDGLWAEFANWMGRSPFLQAMLEWSSERISARSNPETWFISARSWPQSANPEQQGKTLSGLHSAYILALVDESGAIPPTVARAAEQALSNCRFGKLMQAGNPISLEGMLYEAASPRRHLWHVIKITGDPDDPNRSPRIDIDWAREQIQTYGRSNPWVMSQLLGQFPPSSINALLGIEDVERAMKREYRPDAYAHMQKRIGVDVARFGDDRTVLFPRQGLAAFPPVVMRSADTNAIVARVLMARQKWGQDAMPFIDNSFAWGNGVVDNLRHLDVHLDAVNFAGKAHDPRYANRRAEMWITMADAIKGGLALPNQPELVAELTAPTYTFSHGTFQLEDKALIKKRLGRSPDLADALALTYALPDVPRNMERFTGGATPGKAVTEYDHFARAGI